MKKISIVITAIILAAIAGGTYIYFKDLIDQNSISALIATTTSASGQPFVPTSSGSPLSGANQPYEGSAGSGSSPSRYRQTSASSYPGASSSGVLASAPNVPGSPSPLSAELASSTEQNPTNPANEQSQPLIVQPNTGQGPSISAVASQDVTGSSATITWTTSTYADSEIEYGLTTLYGNNTSLDESFVTSHSEIIVNLSPQTLYHFRIYATDAYGNVTISADHTFTTGTASTGSTGVAFSSTTNQVITEGQELQFNVAAAAPNNGSATYSASNLPTGAVFVPSTGAFSWIPGYDQSGNYVVDFSASSGGGSVTEPVDILVLNDPGVIPWTKTFNYNDSSNSIHFTPATNFMIFKQSEPPIISASDGAYLRIFDFTGKTVYDGTPGQIPVLPVGHYFVESNTDRAEFLIVPDDYGGALFLGTGAPPFLTGWTDPIEMDTAAQVNWVRVGIGWGNVEPTEGNYNWTSMIDGLGSPDDRFQSAEGRNIILTIDDYPLPSYVSYDDEAGWISKYNDLVEATLTRYVTKYPGEIKAVEILNEPYCCGVNNGFFPDSPYSQLAAKYVDILKAVVPTIKKFDSSIMVVGPTMQGFYESDLQSLANAGVGQYLDGISWHEYTQSFYDYWPDVDYPGPNGQAPRVDEATAWLKSVFPNKDYIVDEIGFSGVSAIGVSYVADPTENCGTDNNNLGLADNWYDGFSKVSKTIIMYVGGGVKIIAPSNFNLFNPNCPWAGWETGPEPSRGPKPNASAFLMLGYWLNNASFVSKSTIDNNQAFVYAFQRSDGSALVFAWTLHGYQASLATSIPNVTMTNIFGQSVATDRLTEEPLMFRSSTLSPSALLQAVRNSIGQTTTAISQANAETIALGHMAPVSAEVNHSDLQAIVLNAWKDVWAAGLEMGKLLKY